MTPNVEQLNRTYAEHPLSAATILARLQRSGKSLDQVTEMDLAFDDETLITDQNHVGGGSVVQEIAGAIGLEKRHRVMDIASGLAGTSRLLAHLYGCRCDAVEITDLRHQDAILLTRLVNLDDKVFLTRGDFMAIEFPESAYDVVLGLGSFMHFPDLKSLLVKCNCILSPGGWLVVDDGYMRRAVVDKNEQSDLNELLQYWNGSFFPVSTWQAAVAAAALKWEAFQDNTPLAMRDTRRNLEVFPVRSGSVSEEEVKGWTLAYSLLERGLIGNMRLLARKA